MNSEINYNILRRKVKNIRISVNKDKVVNVIIPLKYPQIELDKILIEKESWIRKKLLHFDNLKNNFFSLNGNEILYLGKKYSFHLKSEMKNYFQIDEEKKCIYSGVDLLNGKMQEHWLKQEARRIIEERIALVNNNRRFIVKKIFIRSQKTKWGNCSSNKNISFNWRLVKAPLDVIDYLVVHELVHLEEMNHSKNYWHKVSQLCPAYKEANLWLKKYGIGLFY